MAALNIDWEIEQNADWPGIGYFIVDASGAAKTLTGSMVASGSIVDPATGATVLTFSNTPTSEQGLVTYSGNLFIPTVTAAQNTTWTFTVARYQVYLFDPGGPVGDQKIRVGKGSVYLSRAL